MDIYYKNCVECNKKIKERNMIQVKFRTNKPVTVFRCPQCDKILTVEEDMGGSDNKHKIMKRINGFCDTCEERVMVRVLCRP